MKEYKLPEVLRKLLDENKMSYSDLADKICLSERPIGEWLADRGRPSLMSLMSLAWAFDVSIDYLVYGEDEE